MVSNNSPLENLAAFAIVFALGVVFTASFGTYIAKMKNKARHAVPRI
jgi:hypothetical protein